MAETKQKTKLSNNEIYFIIGLFIFNFLLYIILSSQPIVHDDVLLLDLASTGRVFNSIHPQPILGSWFDILFTKLLGFSNTSVRLTSILFTTLTILLIYFIGRRYFSKRTAVIASLFASVWIAVIKLSQMNSAADGGLFTFAFLLSTYLFLRFDETKNTKYLIWTGIAIGISSLVRITGVILLPIILTYYLWTHKWMRKRFSDVVRNVLNVVYIGLISLIPVVLFFILDFIFNNSSTLHLLLIRLLDIEGPKFIITTIPYGAWAIRLFTYFKIIFWLNLVVILCVILYLFSRYKKSYNSESKNDIEPNKDHYTRFLNTQLVFLLILYLVIFSPYLVISRYIMIIIPILALYFGDFLSKISIKKKDIVIFGSASIIFFIMFILLGHSITLVPITNSGVVLSELRSLNFGVGIPFIEDTGYSGFVVNVLTIGVFFFIAALLFILFLIFCNIGNKNSIHKKDSINKKRMYASYSKNILLILLGAGFAFNCFVIAEYSLHIDSPNYSASINALVDYSKAHRLAEPIISLNNHEIMYYLKGNYTQFYYNTSIYELDAGKIEKFKQYLDDNGGSIIFNDIPMIDRSGNLWQVISSCKEVYTYEDKGATIGYIYDCSNLKK